MLNNLFNKTNQNNFQTFELNAAHKKYYAFTFLTFAISLLIFSGLIVGEFFLFDWVGKYHSDKFFYLYFVMMFAFFVYFGVSIAYGSSWKKGIGITFAFWLVVQITLPLLISSGLYYLKITGDLNEYILIAIFIIPAVIILITGALSYFGLVDLTKIKKVYITLFFVILFTFFVSLILFFTTPSTNSGFYKIVDFILPLLYTLFLSFGTFFTWRKTFQDSETLVLTDNSEIAKLAFKNGVDLFVNFALLVFYVLSIFTRRR
ncbi:hypothetical protein NPA08_01500 [Mycoplasmopsis citelli]|uniref:MAG0110 family membrane protein n=1 Tax=Mycoplasmopsis citelli TaxID=171281 RepID=UPI002114ABC5|nr:hypothetical protein [Mycoplasmopsis citelli]UUD36491.1 hypothetical protein NPA08_01500 [Mycoplasmopsis citelli]